ncbi:MAG: PAS domain S-box protein [Anaerolineae bacterium]|nr:PAS domain S-box protein [Candidatus Roseilinea sp.]MDW8450519.1 PAS domain S-box protein [Anaerolineae bacterium]
MTLSSVALNLADLFHVIVDAVIAFDGEQRILFFNKGAEAIFGYTAEEVLGQPLDILLPERFIEIHRRHFEEFAASPVASRPMSERRPIYAQHKDGREFPAEAAIAKLDRGGERLFVVIMRDITQRQRMEDELRLRAQQAAVAAERSRLARDLHDAVTQTLFSVSVIADVLPRIWERNPEEGRRRLNELRQLSRGALAEMRTLLLELRPSALMEANLGDLLRQLAASINSRSGVEVDVQIEGNAELSPDVKVSLYRIAQEALNNVAKHSNATHARVVLSMGPGNGKSNGRVQLLIADDGCGFDTKISKPTHIGLDIMNERAAAIGARLTIQSEIGAGTTVQVEIGD